MSVQRSQRFSRDNPCPVCRGYSGATRGVGKRCYGFRSEDGRFAYCTREEWSADALRFDADAGAWVHDLTRAPGTGRGGYSTRDGVHLRVPSPAPPPASVTLYDYHDADGVLCFQVVRYPDKRFVQRRPDGKGGWLYNLDGVARVLYRLPQLLAADPLAPVFLPEGEKDVNSLRALGLVATTNPGGAGKWRAEYTAALAGRHVVILPDNDEKGREHARAVADALAGVAASVTILTLPDLPPKGDVTDWLNAGGSADALSTLAAQAPGEEMPPFSFSAIGCNGEKENRFHFTTLDNLLDEPEETVAYVWDRTLPKGGISICAAKPKVGKSTLTRSLAMHVSRGDPFFGRATTRGGVLYLCLEEKRAEVAAQFRAMGITGERILIHTGSAPGNALEALTVAVAEEQPVLVIIDPLSRFVRLMDVNAYGEVTRAMEPLIDLGRTSGCHILCVHHLGKGERGGGDSLLGSTALFGAVDTLLIMKRREQVRIIETIQRYGEDVPATVALFDPATHIVSAGDDYVTQQLTEVKAHIVAHLVGALLTEEEIIAQTTGDTGIIGRAIRALVEEKRLVRQGAGKRGSPYRYTLFSPPAAIDEPKMLLFPFAHYDNKGESASSADTKGAPDAV
ncbi:MAG: AAA family ATPase [Thermomicrobiales bacterium]